MAKPGDFYVGAVDLFSVLLPGAALAYLSADFIKAGDLGLREITWGSAEGWIAFLLASYVLGHILSGVGAFLEEIFDPIGWRWKRDTNAEDFSVMIMVSRLDALPAMKGEDESVREKFESIREELKSKYTRRLIKTSVRRQNPAAAEELDRLEAISKFFRSFALLTLIFGLPRVWFRNPVVLPTMMSAWVAFVVILLFALVSLGLYIFQGRRRKTYTYIYFLAEELESRGETEGALVEAAAGKDE